MSDAVGTRTAIKGARKALGDAVDGAIQIETAGGVLQTMAFGAAGKLIVHGGRAAQAALRKNQSDAEGVTPIEVPRWAVLAVTASTVHILPASQFGRIRNDAARLTIPLAEVADIVIEQKLIVASFEVHLVSGHTVRAETKRLGANRHNVDVLRLVKSRITAN